MTDKYRKIFYGTLRTLAKTGIALLVLFLLCRRCTPDLQKAFTGFYYPVLLPASACSLLAAWLSAMRWRDLARMINIRLSGMQAFSLTMQGIFFSLVIPGGAIGGDMVKMAALTGHVRSGSRTEGIFSIFMDRVLGMIALFLLAALLLISGKNEFSGLEIGGVSGLLAGTVIWWILLTLCVSGTAAGILLMFHRKAASWPGIKKLLDFADRKSSGKISRILTAADSFQNHCKKLFFWIAVSIFLIHLLPAAAMVCLLSGIGVSVPAATVIRTVILGNIAGLLPLFPGGIGARDVVTVALLTAGSCPVEEATAAQLMATALMIIFNFTGSVFFILDRKSPEAE